MNETHYQQLLTLKYVAENTGHDVKKSEHQQFNLLHNMQEAIRSSKIFGQSQKFQGKGKLPHLDI